MLKDALLEIGVEHLPARFLAPALSQLEENARRLLKDSRLQVSGVTAHGTLRRLVVLLRGLEDQSQSLDLVVTGPPARLLKDAQGNFTPQSAGFARSQGISPERLETVSTPKGEFLQARKTVDGEPALKVLSRIFPLLIASLEFPKNMEWEPSHFRFARPIRNILALYGGRVVPLEIAGVRSGNKALGPGVGSQPVKIAEPGDYVQELRDRCILVTAEDRRESLARALDRTAAGLDARIDKDPALLAETVSLAEYPSPVPGVFDKEFLELPQVLLATVLKKQLKFFPMMTAAGNLAPRFVGVRDGKSEGQKEIQEGYERVLKARFDDARFYYQRDAKTRLRDKQELLKGVSFHRDLGSMYDKRDRTVQLAIWLCSHLWRKGISLHLGVVEAIARLAYADIVTDVVREFPELQAAMGGHYARRDGESERVALGVEEFYHPVSAKAPIPTHLEGAVVSLSGKMDTLAALFLAGLKPTGSEDPFALRRVGTGIVRIILEKQLSVDIPLFAETACALLPRRDPPASRDEIREFLWSRAEACFSDMGYPADEIQAVEEGGVEDLVRTFKRLAAVHALKPHPEFVQLAGAFKRAANILRQAGQASYGDVSRNLISLEAESALYDAMNRIEKTVAERISRDDYEGGLKRLVELKPCVDRFFETVRVMDAAQDVKQNRLALLSSLVRMFKTVADISHIQPAGS